MALEMGMETSFDLVMSQCTHYCKDFTFCASMSIWTSPARCLTQHILGPLASPTMSIALVEHTFPMITSAQWQQKLPLFLREQPCAIYC